MDPIFGGLIAGGASLLGNLFSSTTTAQQSAANTQAQIAASQQQQATQNAFTEQMSNTAYQRADADMKAAGLNPMMMFGSGSAASTPSASSIQAPMPQTTSPMAGFAGLGDAVNKALSTAVQVKTMDKMSDEMANLEAENSRIKEQTKSIPVERARTAEQAGLTEAETRKVRALMPQIENASRTAANQMKISPTLREQEDKAAYHGQTASKVIDPIATGVSSAMGVKRAFDSSSFRNRFYFGE